MKTLSDDPQHAPIAKLQAENEELRARLQEADETIEAIRSGAVDALVVEEPEGHRIYTLEGAERPYRLFVEEMEQGAATLHTDGTIAWCNRRLARMLHASHEKLVGTSLRDFISSDSHVAYDNLLWQGKTRSGRAEAQLRRTDDALVPAFLTFNALPKDCGSAIGVLVTDLTPQRHHEKLTAAHAALRANEEQLRSNHETFFNLVENAPFGVYIVDAQFHLRQVSAGSQKVFSTVRPLLGRDFAEVLRIVWPEPFATEVIDRFRHTLETGEPYTAPNTTEQRQDIPAVESYDWKIERLTLPDGQLGVVCYFYDITERKQTEEALRESEGRFRLMADAVPVLIWVSDTTKGCTWFNQCWKDFSGRPMEELLGDGWARDVHPDDLDRCMNVYVTHFNARQPFSMEYRMKRHDGEYRWVLDSGIPRFEANGTFAGYIGACVDFTERKRAEEARARLAAIVESSDDAIISKDLNGIISTWNRGAERLFGYTAQEAVGHPVTMLIPSDHLNEEPGILERIRRGEAIQHYETVRQRKDGTRFDISLTVSPIRNSDGQVVGASKVGRDITERKQAEAALQAARAKLQEHARELETRVTERTADLQATNKQLEAFVYSIAHDLRAPLRSMQGFSELLAQEAGPALSEVGRDYANRINRSAQFMDALLADLLAFSRTAQQGIELTAVNLETVTRSVVSRLEKEIREKKARVELAGPWPAVFAHEPMLGQVIFNLISNALKFVAPGVTPVVRVRVQEWAAVTSPSRGSDNERSSGSRVRVWVEDNGIGVAPEHQEQIFRLFTRLHGDTYGGTGVGLAIVQKGIERMGGRVGVESTPGQGSQFWFELPRGVKD